ncbi:uncharacterized protein LOC118267927 [Spodoptera frugiperda]|uniref:Uncharacterized protein LOC118267927 n=1 Tax=Spodoptera frugiperda TaxID=7108 RepID=A0A9R0EJ46_SPOFR|nr:uncharacterized protein LOC118267927 [Spodoptera frugiperda]
MNFKLYVLAYIFGIASAAVYRQRRTPGPGNKPGCYVSSLGRYLKGGKMTEDVHCGRFECHDDEIVISTCPLVSTDDPHCKILSFEGKNLVYPFCCPRVTCDGEMKQEEYDNNRKRLLSSVF